MAYNPELSFASLVKLISFLFWSGLYFKSTVNWPSKCPEWHSRLITLLHGSVAAFVGLSQCGLTTLTPMRFTMKITASNYLLMAWSWGYFAFDLLWCLLYWTDSYVMLCHHASALAAITVYMQKNFTGCCFPCTLGVLEVTNPLLQFRWFLKSEGYKETKLYMIVELSYLSLFLLVRGVFGTYVIIRVLNSQVFDMEEKIITLVFYLVSVVFIYDVLGYVLYRYKNKIGEFTGYLDGMETLMNNDI